MDLESKKVPYEGLTLTEWDKVNGIAPQLFDMLRARATILADQISEPLLEERKRDLLSGQRVEVFLLMKTLQECGVREPSDAVGVAGAQFTEPEGS